MRIVVLCSSLYSETACAMLVRLAEMGHAPAGVLSLATLNRGTLLRKFGQWGFREVAGYARSKLFSRRSNDLPQLHNPQLQRWLEHGTGTFRSVRDVAKHYGFPISVCHDQNSPSSIARLREWSPDLIVFTGGNILRKPLLDLPRLGILNVHLGLLPKVRGMSSTEWSLLTGVPVGITIHFIDAGIDTGPVLQKYELPGLARCSSLPDLRNRLIAFGIEKMGEVVAALDHGTMVAMPQSEARKDNQFFVMHEWLQARAAESLTRKQMAVVTRTMNG